MYRPKHLEKHFLAHTFQHLFGVFAVLVIATLVAGVASGGSNGVTEMLAQTAGSIGSTTGALTDIIAPSAPQLSMPYVTTSAVGLTWTAATDNVGIAGYKIYRDGVYKGGVSATNLTYTDSSSMTPGATITYTVKAIDTSYLESQSSNTVTATIPTSANTAGGTSGTSTTTTPPPPPPATTPPPATPPTTPPPPPATTLIETAFSAQPGLTSSCSTGVALTPVLLLVTKTGSGYFLLSSDTGMANAQMELGEYPLPNGHYSWRAVVSSGYTGAGDLYGTFTLNYTCPTTPNTTTPSTANTTNNTTSSTTSTTTTPPPSTPPTTTSTPPPPPPPSTTTVATSATALTTSQTLPRPVLKMFLDNVPVTDTKIVFNKQEVELRVTTAMGEKVGLYLIDPLSGTTRLGTAQMDDLLSRPGMDVWSYVWNTSTAPAGVNRVYAKVLHSNGQETTTERTNVTIDHTQPKTVASTESILTTRQIPSSEVTTTVSVSTEARKQEILARVTDPSLCKSADECRVYCANTALGEGHCTEFAGSRVATATARGTSLLDAASDERIAVLIADPKQTDIPDTVTLPTQLKRYCADAEHLELCTKIATDNNVLPMSDISEKRAQVVAANADDAKVIAERLGVRAFIDTDHDGVADYDEINLYGTDPNEQDTDKDGVADGAELLARTNPRGGEALPIAPTTPDASTTLPLQRFADESVVFDDPKIVGVTKPDLLSVTAVAVAKTKIDDSGKETASALRLSGTALPNSYVSIYIFSEPIVVTVKADAAGAWTYTMDKELPDGSHLAYSAITDAGGRILAKSEPLPFVKEAAAVSLGSSGLLPLNEKPGFFSGASLYAIIAIVIGVFGIALSIIGFIAKQRHEDEDGTPLFPNA